MITQMQSFMEFCGDFKQYSELYQWSIDHREDFWERLAEFFSIRWHQRYRTVLQNGDRMPGSHWFVGGTLNYAEHCLQGKAEQSAIIFLNEANERRELTYRELREQVAATAAGLIRAGVQSGDRVAGYCPNTPETIIAFLACAAIGAIWSSCSPDFGVPGVLDRLQQIQPKILFAANGQLYNGTTHNGLEKITAIVEGLSSVSQVVLIPYLQNIVIPSKIAGKPCHAFNNFQQRELTLDFVSLPFEHPLYILFSSGTTGAPKCIVHGTGGVLLQHLKELRLHSELRPSSRFLFFTTCGWMMWNWMVSGLAVGATLILYDGSPLHPKRDHLFDIIEQEQISHFGTSAKYLASCEKFKISPRETHQLTHLNTIFSTGSPLLPEQYEYVYSHIKPDVSLCSISGGTDIVSCFALGNPLLPIYPGELQCRGLGLAVEIFNDQGQPVRGEKGELVCTKSFPCMPIAFWNDPQGERYQHAYFDRFPGVWAHGDYAMLTEHDGLIIFGRSDAVLNPGGVRIGTAEIYRQVEKIPEVLDSIVVGQDWENDVRVILFVVLRDGIALDETLKKRISQLIRTEASPRHVPAKILQVQEIPRTVSGKIVELAVRNIIHNRPVTNIDALANPNTLNQFRNLKELQE